MSAKDIRTIRCCVSNLQRFQYGEFLQFLVDQGHDVQLERCQSYCNGCRRQPAMVVGGRWNGVDGIEELPSLMKGE